MAGNPKKRAYSEVSPDKSALILGKPLDVCGKCSKKCTSTKGESIQCDLCGMWAHATCEGISKEQFKAIKSLSSLSNIVYYCQVHDCSSRIKNITVDWVQSRDGSQIDTTVSDLTKKHLTAEHSTIQEAVSDLSAKIDKLQAQELQLSGQISNTSKAIDRHPGKSFIQNDDRKCNVVVYGVEECPPNTPRSARLVRDTNEVSKVFSSIEVNIEGSLILDCFRLGKFKPQQSRPRPILVKLHRAIDAATILANRSQLSPPMSIKPDLSPAEREIESILLTVRWSLIQKGHLRKSIKINSQRSCIYVNNQLYGKVANSQFQLLASEQSVSNSTQIASTVHSQQTNIPVQSLINLESPDHSVSNTDPIQKSN